jgi:hypothetical protein
MGLLATVSVALTALAASPHGFVALAAIASGAAAAGFVAYQAAPLSTNRLPNKKTRSTFMTLLSSNVRVRTSDSSGSLLFPRPPIGARSAAPSVPQRYWPGFGSRCPNWSPGCLRTKDRPWKPTVYLMYENEHLRRLDINGTHTNKTGDLEKWRSRTHKHRWSEAHQDTIAYTPSGIPDVPYTNVTGDRLREVFESFLRECRIVTRGAYKWSDPVLTSITSGRLGVPE